MKNITFNAFVSYLAVVIVCFCIPYVLLNTHEKEEAKRLEKVAQYAAIQPTIKEKQ